MSELNEVQPQPKIFLDSSTIHTPNQTVLRKNYLAEILKEQEETNQAFHRSVSSMSEKLNETSSEQQAHYLHLLGKLENQETVHEQLKTNVQLNDLTNKEVIERLHHLETLSEEVSKVLGEEKLMSQATIDQLTYQEDLTRKIHTKLEDYEELYLDIQKKMQEQESFYQQINDKLQIQDMYHQTVMERMDKQDENAQQMTKQINNLRTILIEKMESAIQSIETKYKQTLNYFSNIFGTKERTVHKFPLNVDKKQKENQEVMKD